MSGLLGPYPPAELRAVAARLIQIADIAESAAQVAVPPLQRVTSAFKFDNDMPALAALAENEYRARRHRDDVFGLDLFGEPAWDMLLDLYVNRARGRRISVTSLCYASARPATTALRWIAEMQTSGLVTRVTSASDSRVSYVELTISGLELLTGYLRHRVKSLPASLLPPITKMAADD
jgi:DNA-binding MarR family transcriptional regulator